MLTLLHLFVVPALLVLRTVGSSFLVQQANQWPSVSSNDVSERSLASITSESEFVVLSHPHFPVHQLRVKKSRFCDPTVGVYTGYLDVDEGAKHLFFYFFESRRDPATDDVMMWINGGPGCSSSMGLLMELGPCNINMETGNSTTWNPYSWTAEANVFFLDQPVGVGFSYADYGEKIETTEDAAKNIHAFLTLFFENFSHFKGRPLHLAGESYAGRYLPAFASYVYDKNQETKNEGREPLNLTSVIIGNGVVDFSKVFRGRHEVECSSASYDVPFQTISNCVKQKITLPRCEKAVRENCLDIFDEISCRAAVNFCQDEVSGAYEYSGRNFYDISKDCLGELCYLESGVIKDFLNQPFTRALLGVETPNNFTSCSSDVSRGFNARMDKYAVPSQFYVAGLLERGVRVLIYSGTYDWQVPWTASRLWLEELEWTGAAQYRGAEFRDWDVAGHKAGEVKAAGLLTFATVRGAGHMISVCTFFLLTCCACARAAVGSLTGRWLILVFCFVLGCIYVPHDKPAEAQTMVSRWLAGQSL